jgi:hypothetical protein
MPSESHEKARHLLDGAMIAGISAEEQRWLNRHLEECAACGQYAELSRRTVGALDSFAFDLDAAGAVRVQEAVRQHAVRLAARESRSRSLWIGVTAALFLTVAGSAAMWQPAAWLAGRWNVPAPAWQIGFAVFWLLPSLLLGMLPLYRGKLLGGDSGREGEIL